jgi:DNA-binding NarL/FixJ family response regulator
VAYQHQLCRAGLVNLLDGYRDFLVVGESDQEIDAARVARERHADMLLLDLGAGRL